MTNEEKPECLCLQFLKEAGTIVLLMLIVVGLFALGRCSVSEPEKPKLADFYDEWECAQWSTISCDSEWKIPKDAKVMITSVRNTASGVCITGCLEYQRKFK